MPPSVAKYEKSSAERLLGEQFVRDVAADDLLGVVQDAVRHRIVVADRAVGQFVDEGVLVEAEARHRRLDAFLEEFDAGKARVLPYEGVEAVTGAHRLRHATEVVGRPHAAGLGDCEAAERVERLAGPGGDPVRVAAARVEHLDTRLVLLAGPVGLCLLGESDEDVLQLEGGEPGVLLDLLAGQARLVHGVFLTSLCP